MTDDAFVNIHDAKTHLSRLVERAARGEEIVIAKAGTPVARLVPLSPGGEPRRLGLWKGRVRIAAGFDDALPEDVLAAFEGGSG
ncbi:MAG: type II toxin-antitoxin system Phd/YefM family antitoxin [Actinomycetota bacterium]